METNNQTVKLVKRLTDGRFIFCKEGVYFALTDSQGMVIVQEMSNWKKQNGSECKLAEQVTS